MEIRLRICRRESCGPSGRRSKPPVMRVAFGCFTQATSRNGFAIYSGRSGNTLNHVFDISRLNFESFANFAIENGKPRIAVQISAKTTPFARLPSFYLFRPYSKLRIYGTSSKQIVFVTNFVSLFGPSQPNWRFAGGTSHKFPRRQIIKAL